MLMKNTATIFIVIVITATVKTSIIVNLLHDVEVVYKLYSLFSPITLAFFSLTVRTYTYILHSQISKQVPGIALSIERGHKHAFSCTEAGASCVAKYVASLIKNQLLHSRQ